MAIPWATNLLHFHLNKLFKNGFKFGIILFGYFKKELGDFFPTHLVTLVVTNTSAYSSKSKIEGEKFYKTGPRK